MRIISADDIEAIAIGASLYGTGGGGDPYIGRMIAESMMSRFGDVELIDVDDIDDDALVLPVALVGAPAVAIEKFPSTHQFRGALKAIEQFLGRKVTALMCAEAGGLNSTIPFCVATEMRLPLIDGDFMGRAFPEIQMTTATLHGLSATPMSLCDDKGNAVVLSTVTNKYTERFVRALATEMGGSACTALYPMSGAEAKRVVIRGSLSMLQRAGRGLLQSRRDRSDPIRQVLSTTGGIRLFAGKIVDVQRVIAGGFNKGEAHIVGVGAHSGQIMRVFFQNEFLVATIEGRPVATTPDLIMLLDSETGEAVTGELMRYGLRATVLGVPCNSQWRTQAGIALAGPGCFGYEFEYVPVEVLAGPLSKSPNRRREPLL